MPRTQPRQLPTQAQLKSLLDYDPATGELFWKRRRVGLFKNSAHGAARAAKSWNTQFARRPAFTANSGGYRVGRINDVLYKAHRVIFKLVTGHEPDQVDHVDGDGLNNSWGNLRSVSHATNLRNCHVRTDNTSGVVGVCFDKARGMWKCEIVAEDGTRLSSRHATLDEAAAVRKTLEADHGYHNNHGRKKKD